MKTMKVALLATAALAAVSVSARADDTAAIKAQLEALTARIAQLETAPAVPTGFSLLTISEATQTVVPGLEVLNKDRAGSGDKATVIGILPTADAPASTTIEWSGYVRAAIVYVDYGDSDWNDELSIGDDGVDQSFSEDYGDDIDVYARGQLKVVGKTDTAVGEVGVQMRLRGDFDGKSDDGYYSGTDKDVYFKEAWGWWSMTPELTLGGGYTGSLGNIGYGYDGACNCYYTDNADVAFDPGDTSQMRLSYASGPISAAIALEDASGSGNYWGTFDALGAAAEIKYSGDSFNGEISAVWREGYDGSDDSYRIGAGVGFSLGDMASISVGAQMGSDVNDRDFWGASILASMNLSDTSHIEVGYGHKDYDESFGSYDTVDAVLVGLYYDPVDQLTIGLEGEWIHTGGYDGCVGGLGDTCVGDESWSSNDTWQIGVVTVFRF